LATNGIEAGVKIRPTEEELDMMDSWPCKEFRSGWDSYFKDKPDKPVMHYSVIAGWFGDHMVMPPGKFFTMFQYVPMRYILYCIVILTCFQLPRVPILAWFNTHCLA
jgi:hypothetical protein